MEFVPDEEKQKLAEFGYTIELFGNDPEGKYFWALTPEGLSLTREPIYSETGAWWHCYIDYLWKLEK